MDSLRVRVRTVVGKHTDERIISILYTLMFERVWGSTGKTKAQPTSFVVVDPDAELPCYAQALQYKTKPNVTL